MRRPKSRMGKISKTAISIPQNKSSKEKRAESNESGSEDEQHKRNRGPSSKVVQRPKSRAAGSSLDNKGKKEETDSDSSKIFTIKFLPTIISVNFFDFILVILS